MKISKQRIDNGAPHRLLDGCFAIALLDTTCILAPPIRPCKFDSQVIYIYADINVMVNFKPGEYTEMMFIQSVNQATHIYIIANIPPIDIPVLAVCRDVCHMNLVYWP